MFFEIEGVACNNSTSLLNRIPKFSFGSLYSPLHICRRCNSSSGKTVMLENSMLLFLVVPFSDRLKEILTCEYYLLREEQHFLPVENRKHTRHGFGLKIDPQTRRFSFKSFGFPFRNPHVSRGQTSKYPPQTKRRRLKQKKGGKNKNIETEWTSHHEKSLLQVEPPLSANLSAVLSSLGAQGTMIIPRVPGGHGLLTAIVRLLISISRFGTEALLGEP